MKINYGCGESPLEGFINIDTEQNDLTKPDIVCDIKRSTLPFKDEEVEVICALHVLEHIEMGHWQRVFLEFHRVLMPNGQLILAYPEFEICAKYFIENHKGARDFWRRTLYGRQHYPGDYHVVPMRTPEVITNLKEYGFANIKYGPEVDEEWSTFLSCNKVKALKSRAGMLKESIFAK